VAGELEKILQQEVQLNHQAEVAQATDLAVVLAPVVVVTVVVAVVLAVPEQMADLQSETVALV
jgi:CHASE3 domain sensor protein